MLPSLDDFEDLIEISEYKKLKSIEIKIIMLSFILSISGVYFFYLTNKNYWDPSYYLNSYIL